MRIVEASVFLAVALGSGAASAQVTEPVPTDRPEPVAEGAVDGTIPVPEPASDHPGEDPEASAGRIAANRLMDEIVVTAQKREERLQDVPISIQAFTQEKLDVLGIQSVQDVQRATPGFTVTNSAGFNITFLRGVGSDAFLPGVDSSVPFYLDGVPMLAIQGTNDTLGRIERIEVLKGPQGTLFGRNATGGTISIVTPEPDEVFSGDVKLEIGNEGRLNAVAYTNIPLADTVAFNVSAFSNRHDNFIANDAGGAVRDVYANGFRVKLRLGTDDLSATLSASYQDVSGNGSLDFQLVRPAPILAVVLGPGDPKFDRRLALDADIGTRNTSSIYSIVLNWKADAVDAKLIAAKQRVDARNVDADFDGTPRPIAEAHGGGFGGSDQYVKQDTVELQFLSNAGTPFSEHVEWVAGLFYLSSRGGFDPIVFNVAADAVNALLPSASDLLDPLDAILGSVGLGGVLGQEGLQLANWGLIDSESYSAYAQATYHVLDRVDFTAGARYQDERRNLVGSRTGYLLDNGTEVILPLPQGEQPELHPKQTSARVALQWRPFGDDDQIYTSWARGYKNPTYNTVNLLGNLFGTIVPLKAERVDTTEIGIKTQLLDGNLQLNTAVFYTVQKNPLSSNVSIPSGGVANFTNAEEAEIKGVDGDFLLVPLPNRNPGLVVTGGFSYLDATFTSFKNGQGYDDASGLGFGGGGVRLPVRDLSGKRVPRVPEFAYQLGLSQRVDFDDGNALELGADMSGASEIYFLPQNSEHSKRDPVTLFNARATYFYTPWSLELTAFCNNITDELFVESAFVSDFGTALIANDNPRLFGLRAKLSF